MIAGINPVPTDKTAAGQTKGKNGTMGKDDFMKLLVAQLQAQDPTNPMEAQDFSAQLAQFSSVEQMFNVNSNLENLQKSQAALTNNSALNLMGKVVDAPGNGIALQAGQPQTLSYSLPANAANVEIDIFDATGNKVTTLTEGQRNSGINTVTWNGLDGKGNPLPPGEYTYQVQAVGSTGAQMLVDTFASGIVSQVTFENGISYAMVNGKKIPAAEITRVGLN